MADAGTLKRRTSVIDSVIIALVVALAAFIGQSMWLMPVYVEQVESLRIEVKRLQSSIDALSDRIDRDFYRPRFRDMQFSPVSIHHQPEPAPMPQWPNSLVLSAIDHRRVPYD